jgi:tRNA threonylcarbamoyladenosine biosynthesis protein TsaB
LSILAIDASGARAGVAVLGEDGGATVKLFAPGRPGLIETLPGLLQQAVAGQDISAVAVTIGPGSFTGLRTAISLAQGFAAAAGLPLMGVTVAEAFAVALPALDRPLWIAIRARRERIFLARGEVMEAFADADIPRAGIPVALAGDAANEVAARLAAAGDNVMLTDLRRLEPEWVAQAALARRARGLSPHAATPLYIDPPEAKLPAAGLRPPPV